MIRENLYRIKHKIIKELKKKWRKEVPFQSEVTFVEKGTSWYDPILAGPSTFVQDCTSAETIKTVIGVLEKLTPDRFVQFNLDYYRAGLRRFGSNWKYADINTVLCGICRNVKIQSYLEIGVRRGRSMAIVASIRPDVQISGFDMWIPNYAAMENPGPDFVRGELNKIGYVGKKNLVVGNSHETVPQYFRENKNAYFDLITVDGDHTIRGAQDDLRVVMPRLKVGGFLVFDDICNPDHTYLKKVWQKTVANKARFITYEYDELGYGVAFAIKKY